MKYRSVFNSEELASPLISGKRSVFHSNPKRKVMPKNFQTTEQLHSITQFTECGNAETSLSQASIVCER